MKIKFCGGAGTVTGSQYLLDLGQRKVLLECGLFQGRRQETYEKNRQFLYDPSQIDAMVLSHAHIDHSGNIPNLVKHGYAGPIYATTATVDLCQLMLRDSAFLQERDIAFLKKRRQEQIEPLYTLEDAEVAMKSFVGIQYGRPFSICPGVLATFREAGHILGSAGLFLEIADAGRHICVGFSGDIGRHDVPILRDPEPLTGLDALIVESTYGNRLHPPPTDVEEDLARIVHQVVDAGGKIIIPAFAVGRTQLIVYYLHRLVKEQRIPDIPIFVDSPLACNATEVFRQHPECFDRDTYQDFLDDQRDPFGFKRLTYVRDVEESKRLNDLKKPHIIISASGMAEGGRILHHLRNNVGNPRNLVLLVGFAAEHTLARRLRDGLSPVRIFGEEHDVRCQVKALDAFSGHADQAGLLEYIGVNPPQQLQHTFLVHGEADQGKALQQALLDQGYDQIHLPAAGQEIEI